MHPRLEAKVQLAKEAIDEVHRETGGPLEDTLEALEDLASHLDGCIDGVNDDIEAREITPRDYDSGGDDNDRDLD